MNILNLCDLDLGSSDELLIKKISKCEETENRKFDCCFVGSYFCSRYFTYLSDYCLKKIRNLITEKNLKLVLVIPIFSQATLDSGKSAINKSVETLGDSILYISVNDFGMLDWISNNTIFPISLGRILANETRDFRYEELRIRSTKPKIMDGMINVLLKKYPRIAYIEFDNIFMPEAISSIEIDGLSKVLHYPYVYQSVGHICAYANIFSNRNDVFNSNVKCKYDCTRNIIKHYQDNKWVIRVGRAVYYKQELSVEFDMNTNLAYWPIELWSLDYENFSAS